MLRLRTFGTLDLRRTGGDELRAVVAQPKRLALLAYLAIASPRGFHQRDKLLALFWPDLETDRARAALNRAIYFLRRELGDDVIISRGDELGLDADRLWCDATSFDQALQAGRARKALELYTGDLLPGFFVSNALGFEQWLEHERPRLRERASDAAWSLADEAERDGNIALAAHWARRGVELAPFQEIGVQRLLVLLDRAGDRAGATEAYNRFAEDLARELELAPSPETRALIDTIRARNGQRSPLEELEPPANGASKPAVERSHDATTLAETNTADRTAARSRSQRPTRRWMLAATIPVVVFICTTVTLRSRAQIDSDRIDVLTFENRTGDPALDSLARAAAERISFNLRRLALYKKVTVVDADGWRLLRGVSLAGFFPFPSPRRAVLVISGTMTRAGTTLSFDAQIADARRGDSAWVIAPFSAAMATPDSAIEKIEQRVLGATTAVRDALAARFYPVVSSPPRYEAYEEYMQWKRTRTGGEMSVALAHLRLATAIDSSFTWPIVEAAMSNIYGGTTKLTDSLVAALVGMRRHLHPVQTHLVDWVVATRADDWTAAHRALSEPARVAPERFGYMFAIAASNLNRPREIVQILSAHGLDTLFANSVQGYWRVYTDALHQNRDHRRELTAARRARAARPASVAAMMQEMRALAALGRTDAVRARIDTLLRLPREAWLIPALGLHLVALELLAHDQTHAAGEALRLSAEWYRSNPAEMVTPVRRSELAEVLYTMGNLDEAEKLYRELASKDTTDPAWLVRLGTIASRRGRRAEAEAIALKLEAMERFVPTPGDDATVGRAKIAALLGDRDRAIELLVESFGEVGSQQLHNDVDFDSLRNDARFRELVRPKG
jgi:serine/threonine-protein kinase